MQGVSAAADSGYDPLEALEDAALARWHGFDLSEIVDEDDGVEEEEEEEEGERRHRSLGHQTGSGRRPNFRSPSRNKKKKHKNGLFANLAEKRREKKQRRQGAESVVNREPDPPKPQPKSEPKAKPKPQPKPQPKPEPKATPKPQPKPRPEPTPAPKPKPIEATTEIVEQEEIVVRENRPPEPSEVPDAEYVPAISTLGGNALGFSEYLLARRLVRLMAEIVTQRVREIHNPNSGWNRTEALVAWIRATGPSRMSSTVFEFLTREVSRVLKNQKESKSAGITWQAVFSDLFVRVVIHGSPMEWLNYETDGRGRISYGELRRRANHSEESLLAACHACSVFTRNIASIDWPLSSPGALGAWLNRIRGQMSDLDTARFGKIACQVSNTPIVMRSLGRLDMSKLLLVLQNFAGAQLAGARLNGANLTRAGFRKTDLENANLDMANLTEASLNYALL
ncbi:MAG: pentapeptide repeat-containing protein, partial [Verrucomicrobiota bacterium]